MVYNVTNIMNSDVKQRAKKDNRLSSILIGLLILSIVASVAVTYWRIMIEQDFVIINDLEEEEGEPMEELESLE